MALLNWLIISLIFIFNLLYLPNISFPALEPRWSLLNLTALVLPAIFLLIFSTRSRENNLSLRLYPFQVFSLLLILWLSLSMIWAVDRVALFSNFFNVTSFVILLIFFSYYLKEVNWERLSLSICLSVALMSMIGLLQYFGLIDDLFSQVAKPASTFVNKNLATPIVVLALPLMYLQTVFNNSRKTAMLFYCCFVVSSDYLMVAMTKSSLLGSTLAFLLLVIAVFFYRPLRVRLRERLNRRILLLVGGWLIILALTVAIHEQGTYPEMTRSISTSVEASAVETSFSTRIPKWTNSLAIIRDFPLQGAGLGGFSAVYPNYHKSIVEDETYGTRFWLGDLHNDPLQYLVELGLVGFVLLSGMFVVLCQAMLALLKTDADKFPAITLGCFFGVTGLLIDSFFNYPLHEPTSLFFCALLAGGVIAEYHGGEHSRSSLDKQVKLDKRLLLAGGLILTTAVFFIAIPYTIAKHRSFTAHYQAMQFYRAKQLSNSYQALKKAIALWPHSSIVMAETSAMSYNLLKRNYSPENHRETLAFNQEALKGHPYRYDLNYIRVSLLTASKTMLSLAEAETHIPLLLKVAPDDKIAEAYKLIKKSRAITGQSVPYPTGKGEQK